MFSLALLPPYVSVRLLGKDWIERSLFHIILAAVLSFILMLAIMIPSNLVLFHAQIGECEQNTILPIELLESSERPVWQSVWRAVSRTSLSRYQRIVFEQVCNVTMQAMAFLIVLAGIALASSEKGTSLKDIMSRS